MRYLAILWVLCGPVAFAQLSIKEAQAKAREYKLGAYDYHQTFVGHLGYGAPVILTMEGGAAFFGDFYEDGPCGLLVRINEAGNEEWRQVIRPQFDEMESQSVIEDGNGSFYVFILSYNHSKYRGGTERVVFLDKDGKVIWDKLFGHHDLLNSPIFSYIRLEDDGRIGLRGHIVTERPQEGDPKYHYWEGWIDSAGSLTQKVGDIINWSNQSWQEWYKPE